jgi:hypothetical protein
MSKTFAQAPRAKPLAPEIIAAFENGGTGQDTQTHISPKVQKMVDVTVDKPEPKRRLSIDLPESLHRRFKTACSKTDKKMLAEVTNFIRHRTIELENE